MTILDTSVVIDRVRARQQIPEDIVEVTVLEYPPILAYREFTGSIVLVERRDWRLALELQIKLRRMGKPKGLADLLIAAVAINRGEELVARDRDYLDIARVSDLKLRLIP
ncbi:hypothetical protein Pyrde_1364 [Pyrodictium delaneyi]|uniref:DNA-binding protein n=1 Tax=Pyrodictium delaneyi TaxID=1273541 RepID=A0A0P0N4Q6_9CREN|nr:type II toxin-antitoxin system VapC family toxin [Pyrodictium delaneyi]ALL01410.1 hypothetical protein Pyrde_1364 [Pyrodictium delaneyi]OWJ54490.1 DNA-binding protein [Pyrodictium delaneyi]OWJ54670.1 DNA-binding protein [Pyrodictium delaneyi]